MVNLQEAIQFGIRLAQFVVGLLLATVSAFQQIDVAGAATAGPEETAQLPTERLPTVGTMSAAEAEQAISIRSMRNASPLASHHWPTTRRSLRSLACAPPTCLHAATSATTTRPPAIVPIGRWKLSMAFRSGAS